MPSSPAIIGNAGINNSNSANCTASPLEKTLKKRIPLQARPGGVSNNNDLLCSRYFAKHLVRFAVY
jgi:hypothetical protein